ncbi:hypothetical protein G9C01_01635 [Blattabacterium sp. DPU]|uniref:hypothetical protein n=1 Tax=Blattabacterium sp. DPU TaxID=2715232 RepID=UPI00140830A4|nr:hypothetical protein [Blattabacterium sp. DPU]QIK16651.1 hypothetical protein G9C01_01635 [Blattabacterium sp. DPU]
MLCYRNIFSIFIGVTISIIEILYAIKFVKKRFLKIQSIPLKKFKYLLIKAPTEFFVVLIFFYAFSALLGGLMAAFFSKNAKKAYAILTGFILFFITLFHVFFYPFPFWFKIIILPIFFSFSYIGGNLVEFLQKKKWIN